MKRRQEMRNAPILIVNFSGVLGNTSRSLKHISNNWRPENYYRQTQEDEVVIRQGAAKNLKFLMGNFQLVLFMNKYVKKQDPIVGIIESKVGDVFDAIYTRTSYTCDNKVIDYSQVFEDFGVLAEEIDDRVAVLWPLNMELEEVKDRDREELLFLEDLHNCKYKNLVVEGIPMNSNGCRNPLAFLFTSLNGVSNKLASFARLTKFLNLMINAFEEERSKDSWNKSDNSEEEDFSFIKGFKALQNLITKNNISTLKGALFSTNKIAQSIKKQKANEELLIKSRESKKETYKSQIEREELHKKFMEYNFHLAKTNAYINLKSQNNHTSRHINQYYNDFYYELIEKEEEDIDSRQGFGSSEIDRALGKHSIILHNLYLNLYLE